MSAEHKFFDEWTETIAVSLNFFITRLRSRIEPDTEVHVTSKTTRQGGSFRSVWVNDQPCDGWYDVGLELLDVEGNIWGKDLARPKKGPDLPIPEAHLECTRCHTVVKTAIPEALEECLRDGFRMARGCDHCKGSTNWTVSAKRVEESRPRQPGGAEERRKGRVAIKMKIRVYCDRLGARGEGIFETINVSANGLYFMTPNDYLVGDALRIIAPYQEGAMAIPVPARVVRLEHLPDSNLIAVAVEMQRGPA